MQNRRDTPSLATFTHQCIQQQTLANLDELKQNKELEHDPKAF